MDINGIETFYPHPNIPDTSYISSLPVVFFLHLSSNYSPNLSYAEILAPWSPFIVNIVFGAASNIKLIKLVIYS